MHGLQFNEVPTLIIQKHFRILQKLNKTTQNAVVRHHNGLHFKVFKYFSFFFSRPVMKHCCTAVSPSEVRVTTSYLWGTLGQARGPTAPRGTEPPLAPMPPPCHQGAAARCLGQSSSAWCEEKRKQGGGHSEPEALSQPAEDKGDEARLTFKPTKLNSFVKFVRDCPVESSCFEIHEENN